jgi:hydroxymethylbilane synthase
MTVLRVGTRGSALAVAQTRAVAQAIAGRADVEIELVTVTTHGDTSRESLKNIGGTGVFASALRDALLAGECDVIVHSFKDLPTAPVPGIELGAVPKRADARDALCARDGLTLDDLPVGARVGTGSPRRIAQLRAARGDLDVRDIRGNVDSRLARVFDDATPADDRLDAVVLAAAGLGRLGRADAATQLFDLADWPTAPAQGALALEVREPGGSGTLDKQLRAAVAAVNHVTTHATAMAERFVLAGLEAGCAAPVATTAMVDDGLLFVTATVYALDGSARITASHAASLEGAAQHALIEAAHDASSRVVAELLAEGAGDLAPLGGTA